MKVLIEEIFSITNRGRYVLLRPVVKQQFTITEKSLLNGIPLEEFLEVPRKLKENGEPDLDVFCVKLKNEQDVSKLEKGTIADLTESH